ncbi:PREDICTED: 1-aminocyclopropane-1-carboxylate oxidase homolog 4-like [Nelumbo nucifera]|nr:PREDICTED: 1-aminocyclopropane-1-carboxylate oxidase homolog 4-like [Nelumbo nucifera]
MLLLRPSSSTSLYLGSPFPQSIVILRPVNYQFHVSKGSRFLSTQAGRTRRKMGITNSNGEQTYDRTTEVKQFDDSKIGVKGLVDSGITSIPRFFVHPPETLPSVSPTPKSFSDVIPTVDLSGITSNRRIIIVDQIREASHELGFFQIINHGIPSGVLNRTIAAVKGFNEQPTEVKSWYYGRGMSRGVAFSTNFDLFQSKAASWRDTIQLRFGSVAPDYDSIPEICRKELIEWDQHITRLGETLMEILCEGLGLDAGKLKELMCLDERIAVAHYYPYCPQPDLTYGITSHTDPGALTVLVQNEIGGLQVKHGEDWVDVKPIAGALVINIGDLLQIISNDEYRSVEHRVLANPFPEARVSIASFFNPSRREDLYGPLPELVSAKKPALYRQFTFNEYLRRFFSKELDGKSLINYFKF